MKIALSAHNKKKDEIIEKARKYFNFDADAEKVLSLAAKIN